MNIVYAMNDQPPSKRNKIKDNNTRIDTKTTEPEPTTTTNESKPTTLQSASTSTM